MAKYVCYNEVSLYQGSFPYILLLLGRRILFFIPTEGLLNRRSNVHVYHFNKHSHWLKWHALNLVLWSLVSKAEGKICSNPNCILWLPVRDVAGKITCSKTMGQYYCLKSKDFTEEASFIWVTIDLVTLRSHYANLTTSGSIRGKGNHFKLLATPVIDPWHANSLLANGDFPFLEKKKSIDRLFWSFHSPTPLHVSHTLG